ncbi:hypothetical protein GY45DRAFT_723785 [Cubamyces sp. BRFM 1775]|nr:hypothetical protein GY45DRAFT_723785 [Cubamyces sp. BRFM 1775]
MTHQPCEVIPGAHELPCAQRGYGQRPRLCNVHRQEYSRLTSSYKAKSEKADRLYDEVCGKDWEDRALWNMRDVTNALATAAHCQEAIEEEILGRRRHHDRFFADRDSGHEAWIRRRREKAREVEAIAKQLRVCKTMLAAEEQTRQAEARRREEALQCRKEESAGWGRDWAYPYTSRQATTQYLRPHDDPLFGSSSQPESYRTVCMVLQPGSTTLRCNREVVWGKKICQQHSKELETATTKLRQKRYEKDVKFQRCLDDVSWCIRVKGWYDQHTLDQYIAKVVECKELLSSIDALSAQVDRLSPGEPASPSQSADHTKADDLLRRLRTIQPRARTPPTYTRPDQDNAFKGDTSESWAASALLAVGTAVAVWFGFKR